MYIVDYNRFIMIKYADRGLVKKGRISPLFQQLYILFTSTIMFLIFLIIFMRFKFQNQATQEIVDEICSSTQTPMVTRLGAFKNIGKFAKVFTIFIVGCWYWRSVKFIGNRSKIKSKPPAIIGRFQRNIITYSDTVILHMVFKITSPFFLYFISSVFGRSLPNLTLSLIRNISICIIVGIILPAYTIFNLHRKIPDFFSGSSTRNMEANTFYVRTPIIGPRRDFMSEILQLKNIRWSSRRTQRCFLTGVCQIQRLIQNFHCQKL